jgi:hypothetical protein
MQKLRPFYGDIKFFCKKYQNSCLLFFVLTRSQNINKSQILIFSNLLSFSFIFQKTRKVVRGGGAGKISSDLTCSTWVSCIASKSLNLNFLN